MEEYYDTTRVPFAYQAYPARFDRVDRYYDDNGLVGIDYIDTYAVTKNPAHLEKAKQIFTYILEMSTIWKQANASTDGSAGRCLTRIRE